jgi:hypothetical protein
MIKITLIFFVILPNLAFAADAGLVECEVVCANSSGLTYKYEYRSAVTNLDAKDFCDGALRSVCGSNANNSGSKVSSTKGASKLPNQLLMDSMCNSQDQRAKSRAQAVQ